VADGKAGLSSANNGGVYNLRHRHSPRPLERLSVRSSFDLLVMTRSYCREPAAISPSFGI